MAINRIVGVYIPIIRIPIDGGMTIPNIRSLDPGTYGIHMVVPSPEFPGFLNFSQFVGGICSEGLIEELSVNQLR